MPSQFIHVQFQSFGLKILQSKILVQEGDPEGDPENRTKLQPVRLRTGVRNWTAQRAKTDGSTDSKRYKNISRKHYMYNTVLSIQ